MGAARRDPAEERNESYEVGDHGSAGTTHEAGAETVTESATTDEQQPGTQVMMEVSGCHESDAQAVFEALRTVFPSDRAADDTPHQASADHPTIWAATFDVGTRKGTARPPRLAAPVTLDVAGGYHAVDLLRSALSAAFAVQIVGTASGDQENEVQLRLENKPPEKNG